MRLELHLTDLGDPSRAARRSSPGLPTMHRIVDERRGTNACYVTQDTRRALDFIRTHSNAGDNSGGE